MMTQPHSYDKTGAGGAGGGGGVGEEEEYGWELVGVKVK
jgi:hypothetical protein